jgi:DNA-binding CsgD family transcriptional regulator
MPAQGQLTPREAEVAVLVRANMSNREISDTLGITQHTVESHLKSIFNRLGIRSRWQIDRVLSRD